MILNLKQAKVRLSELVEHAARGEEVVIAVRGKAKARLCGMAAGGTGPEREAWGERLATARLLKCGTVATADSRMRDAAEAWGIAGVAFD